MNYIMSRKENVINNGIFQAHSERKKKERTKERKHVPIRYRSGLVNLCLDLRDVPNEIEVFVLKCIDY